MKFHGALVERSPSGRKKDASLTTVQRRWNVCCQSLDEHRFDCTTDAEYRGAGPLGPVRQPTPAELARRLAGDAAGPSGAT